MNGPLAPRLAERELDVRLRAFAEAVAVHHIAADHEGDAPIPYFEHIEGAVYEALRDTVRGLDVMSLAEFGADVELENGAALELERSRGL